MKNAHLRMGSLRFTKVLRDTTIDITLRMDRMIAEHDADNRSAQCHLLSVIGNDQEIAAIAAAIADEARFYATGPEINRLMITLGKEAVKPGLRERGRHMEGLVKIRGGRQGAELLGIALVDSSEAAELAFDAVEVAVMIGVAGDEPIPADQVVGLDPRDDVHRERQPRDPRRSSRLVGKVKLRRRRVFDSSLGAEVVAHQGEQMRLDSRPSDPDNARVGARRRAAARTTADKQFRVRESRRRRLRFDFGAGTRSAAAPRTDCCHAG